MSRAADSKKAAKSGISENQGARDAEIAAIATAWPTLPPAVRTAILDLVNAATSPKPAKRLGTSRRSK